MSQMFCEEPKYALVEVEGGYVVEPFSKERHICEYGWTYNGVSLFSDPEDVSHLRDQILN